MFRKPLNRSMATLRAKRRQLRPSLDCLESRTLLSSTPLNGGKWTYGSRITYSFVPDGTSVGGPKSDLNSRMAANVGASWQDCFQKAAALWSLFANINLAQVPDSGDEISADGKQQGDSRFGDIRIASIPQSNMALAFSLLPPPISGGSDAGDIVFNSNITFGQSGFDLTTVAIHEFGHALGLDHSQSQADVMYAYWNGANQGLSDDDNNAIVGLYGPYAADPVNDQTSANATPITLTPAGNATINGKTLSGTSDYDWFSVVAPANTNGYLFLTMQTYQLSSASPRIQLYASNATTGIVQASYPDHYGTTVTVQASVTAGTKYYIRAMAGSVLGSKGAYALLLRFNNNLPAPFTPPYTVVDSTGGQGGGSQTLLASKGDTLLSQATENVQDGMKQLQTKGRLSTTQVDTTVPNLVRLSQSLSTQGAASSDALLSVNRLIKAYLSGRSSAQLAASKNFLEKTVQAGTLTSFGDALTVKSWNSEAEYFGKAHPAKSFAFGKLGNRLRAR